jgi:mRNA interferase RelE/StbE
VKKLVNSPYYRLRVGDYRIILDVQENRLRILFLKVGPRDSIYNR